MSRPLNTKTQSAGLARPLKNLGKKKLKMVRSNALIPMFKNKVVDQEIISEMAD